ncbi:MAG: hypothetical protein ACJ8J7_02660 [Sulfurifustaceae bacterium]
MARAGAGSNHVALAADRFGHCAFRTTEALGALALLLQKAGVSLSAQMPSYRNDLLDSSRTEESVQ